MKRSGRKCQVVDTNVLVVANRRDGGSYTCASNCARALMDIKNFGVIVLDDADRILSEYRGYCRIAGQPGIGDSFMKWLHDNFGRRDLVNTVGLTPADGGHQFLEFPEHPELDEFDPADEKFVAVANAHRDKPPILQATDSKWWGWKDALRDCGLSVELLCPGEVEATYQKKFDG